MEKPHALAIKLLDIQAWDEALALAGECGFLCGFCLDPEEPEWPVAFIELPTGQISWHLPQHPTPWDGHTTEQKQVRMLKWIADTLK